MKLICIKGYKSLLLNTVLFCLICTMVFIILININDKNKENYISTNEICDDSKIYELEKSKQEEFLKTKYQEKKLIALTFDDGPGKYTEELIDKLNERNVKATFFVLGENVLSRKSTLKYIADNNHEIGIHSYVHKLFTRISDEEIEIQIDKTRNVIYSACNTDIKLIRVPYGSINTRVNCILENNQLTNVLWDVDSKDWSFRNTDKIYKYTLKRISGNDIILMHDIYKTSVEAAIKLVDSLQKDCYVFVTVSELLHIRQLCS